jgi:hypothetical protein
VHVAESTEFPFCEELPKPSGIKAAWSAWLRYLELTEKHGHLVNRSCAALMLHVSKQRVDQLIEAGLLDIVKWEGKIFVTALSIQKRNTSFPVSHRPRKIKA